MKNLSTKLMLGAVSLAGLAATTAPAFADDTDWGTVSAYVDVQSDYRFRGISQNNRDFAPQASINWSGPDGFYAGVWASKIDWLGASPFGGTPSLETDFYGGKHFDLGGTDLNVEAYYYGYPEFNKAKFGALTGVFGEASFLEGIVQLSHSFGDLAVTATGAFSPQFTLSGGVSEYVEGSASYPLLDWLSISANVGHQWVDAATSDYTHFDIGLTATWHSWALDVRANGTDLNTANCGFYMVTKNACTTGVVATLTYNIADVLK
ncbi:MAG: TorF family putative porin [Rhizomicrobium sp.]